MERLVHTANGNLSCTNREFKKEDRVYLEKNGLGRSARGYGTFVRYNSVDTTLCYVNFDDCPLKSGSCALVENLIYAYEVEMK